MRILIIGAGVLGSVYAARLLESGQQVTLMARGARLEELRKNGLVLEDAATGRRMVWRIRTIEKLDPDSHYDLAIVLVRRNQVGELMPILAANRQIPNFLFMFNNISGPGELINAVGKRRVLLGFPGAGGQRVGPAVRYQILPALLQPTTLGEVDGRITPRLLRIAALFRTSGFPVAISRNMDAWLKTHAAIVSPIANAIYAAGGNNYRLARTRDGLALLLRAIREGFQVLDALGVPITPGYLNLIKWLPEPVLIWILQLVFGKRWVELVMTRHALAARDEMLQLARDFRSLARSTWVATPAIDELFAYIDPEKPVIPDGSARLPLRWQSFWVWVGALFSLVYLRKRRKRPGRLESVHKLT